MNDDNKFNNLNINYIYDSLDDLDDYDITLLENLLKIYKNRLDDLTEKDKQLIEELEELKNKISDET